MPENEPRGQKENGGKWEHAWAGKTQWDLGVPQGSCQGNARTTGSTQEERGVTSGTQRKRPGLCISSSSAGRNLEVWRGRRSKETSLETGGKHFRRAKKSPIRLRSEKYQLVDKKQGYFRRSKGARGAEEGRAGEGRARGTTTRIWEKVQSSGRIRSNNWAVNPKFGGLVAPKRGVLGRGEEESAEGIKVAGILELPKNQ